MFWNKINTDSGKIENLLSWGVEEIFEADSLRKKLLSGEKLRVKFGVDPTMNTLHLGHSLPLKKLQQFLDLGHQVVLLIGDFTATIGDPSGRLRERPVLSRQEVERNMKEYVRQAGKILDTRKAEIRHNSEWYEKKDARFFMELASQFTYTRLMDRAEFKERIRSGGNVTMAELFYPLLQGYDSVELRADVEIGGTEQKFNLLMGRKVQKRFGLPEQDIMTVPLLVGTDGEKKMSKSYGNFIALDDKSNIMFAKIMSIPDSLVWQYFSLLTDEQPERTEERRKTAGTDIFNHKKDLSQLIVARFYGEKSAQAARDEFAKVFSQKGLPSEIDGVEGAGKLIIETGPGLNVSKSEIKRLIDEGAVSVNGKIIKDWHYQLQSDDLLKIGSHKFVKIK